MFYKLPRIIRLSVNARILGQRYPRHLLTTQKDGRTVRARNAYSHTVGALIMQNVFDLNGPNIHALLPTIARSRFRGMAVLSLCKTTILRSMRGKLAAQVVGMRRREKRYKLTKYAMFGRAKLMFGACYESQLLYISWGGRFHVASTLRLTTLRAQSLKPTLPQSAQ